MGGAPPPRLAAGEHIPLPPTMQPHVHIFSHTSSPAPQPGRNRPRCCGFPVALAPNAATGREAAIPVQARHSASVLQIARAGGRLPERIRSPSPRRHRRKEPPRGHVSPRSAHQRAPPRRRAAPGRRRRGAAAAAPRSRLRLLVEREQRHERPTPPGRCPPRAPVFAGATVRPRARRRRRARGRARAHGPGRPVRAPAGGAADAGLPAAGLLPRRRSLARPARGRLPELPERRRRAAGAARAGLPAAPRPAGPVRHRPRAGGDRARHERPGDRLPRSWPRRPSGPARTRPATGAWAIEPRRPASRSASSHRFAVIGSEAGLHERHRHHARRPRARPRRRVRQARAGGARRRARAPLLQPRRRRREPARRRALGRCSAPARRRPPGELSLVPAPARSTSTRTRSAADRRARRPAVGRRRRRPGARRTARRLVAGARARRTLGAEPVRASPGCARCSASPRRLGACGAEPSCPERQALLEGLLAPLEVLAANTAQARARLRELDGLGADLRHRREPAGTQGRRRHRLHRRGPLAGGRASSPLRCTARATRSASASIPGTEAAVGVRVSGLAAAAGHRRRPRLRRQDQVRARPRRSFGDRRAAPVQHARLGAGAPDGGATALGEGIEPSMILDVPTLLSLLEGVGLTEDAAALELRALPARDQITRRRRRAQLGGAVERFKLVVGPARRLRAAERRRLEPARRVSGAVRVDRAVEDRATGARRDRRRSGRACVSPSASIE